MRKQSRALPLYAAFFFFTACGGDDTDAPSTDAVGSGDVGDGAGADAGSVDAGKFRRKLG